MPDTNNVRIKTPTGEIFYYDGDKSSNKKSSSSPDINTSGDGLTSSDSGNEIQTISIINVGDGKPVFAGKINSTTYGIKSIVAGDNINIVSNSDTLVISAIKNSDSGVNKLSELQDVDIKTTPPVNGDILAYNGSEWVNLTPDWSGKTAKFPSGSLMVIKISGILGTTDDNSDSDTRYLKSLTSYPSTWDILSIDNNMVSINTNLSSGTAFPINMYSSVGSVLQLNSTSSMVTSTSYSPNQAMMDYNDSTGILNLYRINSQTIFCSGDETKITIYLGFYIIKDQATLWS